MFPPIGQGRTISSPSETEVIHLLKWTFLLFMLLGAGTRPLLQSPHHPRHRARPQGRGRRGLWRPFTCEVCKGGLPGSEASPGTETHSWWTSFTLQALRRCSQSPKLQHSPPTRGQPHDSTFLLVSESLSYQSSSLFSLKIVGFTVVCA